MITQRQSTTFIKLQRPWYRKIRELGFVDIEAPCFQKSHSKYSTWYFEAQWDNATFRDRERYFQLAGQHLHHHKFKTSKEKKMWQLHSQGDSNRELVRYSGLTSYRVAKFIKEQKRSMTVGEE